MSKLLPAFVVWVSMFCSTSVEACAPPCCKKEPVKCPTNCCKPGCGSACVAPPGVPVPAICFPTVPVPHKKYCGNPACKCNACVCCPCKCDPCKKPVHKNAYKHLLDSTVQVRVYPTPGNYKRFGMGTGWVTHGKDGTTFVVTAGHVASSVFHDGVLGEVKIFDRINKDDKDVGYMLCDAELVALSFCDKGLLPDVAVLKVVGQKHFKHASKLKCHECKKCAVLGDKLLHAGCTLDEDDGVVVTTGFFGKRGVKHGKQQLDFVSIAALPGCSGGPVANEQGCVVGMMCRGKGECASLVLPLCDILKWAKEQHLEYVFDSTVDVPKVLPTVKLPEKKKEGVPVPKLIPVCPFPGFGPLP